MKPVWLLGGLALAVAVLIRRHRLNPPFVIAGLIGAVAMGVYGTGVIEIPDLGDALEAVGRTLGPWTYLLVGVMSFLEAGAFIGLMLPGETTIVVGGVIAGQGQIDIVVLIAIAWSAAFAGDLTGYFLGRKLGRPFIVRHGPRFGVDEARIDQVESFFAHHGGKAIFIGRFIGVVRSLSPFLAGSSRMPLSRFIPYDILGSGLQSSMLCLLGYFFWHSLDRVLEFVERGAIAFGITIALIVGIVIAVRWLRVEANRRRLAEWFEVRREKPAVALVLGIVAVTRRPVRFLVNRLTPGGFGLELTTLLAAASVGGYVFFGYLVALDPSELTLGDRRAREWAEAFQIGGLRDVASVVALLGALPAALIAVFLTGVALFVKRRPLEALALWSGMALTAAGIAMTKGAVWVLDPADWPREGLLVRERPPGEAGTATYPSAAAAYSVTWVAVALALRHAIERLASVAAILIAALLASASVAAATVYLGRDWLSDAVGGLGLGVFAFGCAGVLAVSASVLLRSRTWR